MKDFVEPKRWNENSSCHETVSKISEYIMSQDITKKDAKGIISMLCRNIFGEEKGHLINGIMNL